jgi:hypothetical protein
LIASAMDNYLRAFDTETGAELWKGRLPAGGQAMPMTYLAEPAASSSSRSQPAATASSQPSSGIQSSLIRFHSGRLRKATRAPSSGCAGLRQRIIADIRFSPRAVVPPTCI